VVIPPAAETSLADHEDWASRTLRFAALYALLRLSAAAAGWMERSVATRVTATVAGVGAGLLVSMTADRGGRLVYLHGLGVRHAQGRMAGPSDIPGSGGPALETGRKTGPYVSEDSVVWDFQAGDEAGLRQHFEAALGSWDDLKATSAPARDGLPALVLEKTGRDPLILVLDAVYADVQVEAVLDLAGFTGTAGLIHHFAGDGYDLLALRPGRVALERVRGGTNTVLAASEAPGPPSLKSVRAVCARGHLRGYVGDTMVVHGHATAGPPGKVGLLLDGHGSVALRRLAATRLAAGR
jgi:hypothetical protein